MGIREKSNYVWQFCLIGCFLIDFLTGCATATPEAPTPKPTAIPTETSIPPTPIPQPTGTYPADIQTIERVEILFDGENCIYDGPIAIQHGEFTVFFDNQTDEVVLYDIFLLTEGKSWQDVVDNFAGGGRNVEMPDWAILQSGSINIKDTREKAYNLEPGSYALACSEILQTGGWIDYLGSPLEVK